MDEAERNRILEKEEQLEQLIIGARQDSQRWDSKHKSITDKMDALSRARDTLYDAGSYEVFALMREMDARKDRCVQGLNDAARCASEALQRLFAFQNELFALYELYPQAFRKRVANAKYRR